MAKKVTKIDIYKGFEGKPVEEVTSFLLSYNVHCVKCKEVFAEMPTLIAPIKNAFTIQLVHSDGTKLNGVPAAKCGKCGYENTVLKLISQTMK